MVEKTATEVMQEIKEARQHFGTVNMIIDAAQVHFVLESLLESVKSLAIALIGAKTSNPVNWGDSQYGTPEEVFKVSKELGLTGFSLLKTFLEALPDSIKEYENGLTVEKIDQLEALFMNT